MNRATRKQSYSGQQVCVELKDGRKITGSLIGWGIQVVVVAPAEQTPEWPWKRHTFSVASVANVFNV